MFLALFQVVGNHEWDKGLNELKRYFDKLDYPALAANINFREWHGLKDKISSYVVKHVKGRKVGSELAALSLQHPSSMRATLTLH
jgi:2',3'-cyclic-nucleotide 2'-phosphodiesterase (5'-nucleotidase family)